MGNHQVVGGTMTLIPRPGAENNVLPHLLDPGATKTGSDAEDLSAPPTSTVPSPSVARLFTLRDPEEVP
jgi:hypothetical protein